MKSLFFWCRRSVLLAIILTLFLEFNANISYAQTKDSDAALSSESLPEVSTLFGGPYPFLSSYYAKISSFGTYYSKRLLLSRSTMLTSKLFRDSVTWYEKNRDGFVRGDLSQKYNYIITTKGDIRVAVWSKNMDFAVVAADGTCVRGSAPSFSAVIPAGLMINSYPEEPYEDIEPISPCWIDVPPQKPKNKVHGLLDAMGKHLFLAQEESLQDEALLLFNPSQWTKTEVAYAGELLIDVKTGTYALNRQSGTYLPDERYLDEAARHFALKLGIRPVTVIFNDGTRRAPYLPAELGTLPMTLNGSSQ